VVNWTERGLFVPGNSVPRWHIAWGTGWEIVDRLVKALECHPQRNNLQLVFDHEVNEIDFEGGQVAGVSGKRMDDGAEYTARGEATIIASGGICGGNMSFLRDNWCKEWGEPPKKLLNGAHQYGDGMLHKVCPAKSVLQAQVVVDRHGYARTPTEPFGDFDHAIKNYHMYGETDAVDPPAILVTDRDIMIIQMLFRDNDPLKDRITIVDDVMTYKGIPPKHPTAGILRMTPTPVPDPDTQ
jgi:hypothetical protein